MSTKTTIDPDLVRALASVLADTGLTEIEVHHKDMRIRLARQPAPPPAPAPMSMPMGMPHYAPPPQPTLAIAHAAAEASAAPAPEGPAAPSGNAVASPMVGTAYRAPAPDKPNFVELGQQVRAGQTLLVIEAMKTFNEIPAPRAGKVTAILFENAEPVEFGQALVVIE